MNLSNESTRRIEFVLHSNKTVIALSEFFDHLVQNGDDRYFHPHPFTLEESTRLANIKHSGFDLYYVAIQRDEVLAYGMLRGWDAGFEIPSLGIAVHKHARGFGVSKAMMEVMHCAASWRGAKSIRLKVHTDNKIAQSLYEKIGYKFIGEEGNEFVALYTFK